MNWITFKEALIANANHHLQFQYAPGSRVKQEYHITEIKLATINAVDCGAKADNWKEIILQLVEPQQVSSEVQLTAAKALKIIDKVEAVLSLDTDAIVKIEFGNEHFTPNQLLITDMDTEEQDLIFYAQAIITTCKAADRAMEQAASSNVCCGTKQSCC